MILACGVLFAIGLSSCGAVTDYAFVYTGVTKPVTATSNVVGNKVGTVKTMNLFNIAAWGDASINKAAKMAGITKISHVDVKTTSVLTIFNQRTYFVYGE